MLESKNAVAELDVNRSLNVELNNPLNQTETLKIFEKNEKKVRPILEDFKQSIQISEKIMQGQADKLKIRPQMLENVKQDFINFNSLQIGLNDSCSSTGSYQKAELKTENVKTDFIITTIAQIKEVTPLAVTSDFASLKNIESKAESELVLQKSANVNQVLTNSKESEYKKEEINKERLQTSLLEHYSIDCKQNVSLSSEKILEPIKKPKKKLATKNLETSQNILIIEQTNSRENEEEHKVKKRKKSKATPHISTQEAIIVCSIEPSIREESLIQAKILFNQAKKSIKPMNAIQVSKVNHFDLESEKEKEFTKTDFAQQDISLNTTYEVNEIVLDSSLNKLSTEDVESKKAQVNFSENQIFITSTDQCLLEKENSFKIVKDLDQHATKHLIPQQPVSINQTKGLENSADLIVEKRRKQKADLSLLDQQIVKINKTQPMDKELNLEIKKKSVEENATKRKLLNKVRSISIERPQLLDKEQELKKIKSDQQKANLEFISNKTSSHSEIQTLENETNYKAVKLQLEAASTKLDFDRPIEIEFVLANENDSEFKREEINIKQPRIQQEALHLVAADSVCVQSEFMHSPKTGKLN